MDVDAAPTPNVPADAPKSECSRSELAQLLAAIEMLDDKKVTTIVSKYPHLLKAHVDPKTLEVHESPQRGTDTLVNMACKANAPQVLIALIKMDVDVDIKGINSATSLSRECASKHLECATLLLTHGADPFATDAQGHTALHCALHFDNVALVKAMLHGHPLEHRLNCRQPERNFPVHSAKSVAMLKVLRDHGANMNVRDADGDTLLHLAILNKNVDVVKWLLKKGANPHVTNYSGRSQLAYAVAKTDAVSAQALVGAGADINSNPSSGYKLLHSVVHANDKSGVELVLALPGVDVNAVTSKLKTPLYFAKSGTIAQLLIRAGAHFDVTTSGRTPLHCAAKHCRIDVALVLLEAGVVLEAVDYEGLTALHRAAKHGKPDMCEFLLSRGASPTMLTNGGLSAIALAHIYGHPDAEEVLRKAGCTLTDADKNGKTRKQMASSSASEMHKMSMLRAALQCGRGRQTGGDGRPECPIQ